MAANKLTFHQEIVNGYRFRMVSLPGGVFEMGDAENKSWLKATPVHQVELSSFSIGEYPVTQALWKAVKGDVNSSYFKGGNRPVEQVSWNEIVVGEEERSSFLQKLNACPC